MLLFVLVVIIHPIYGTQISMVLHCCRYVIVGSMVYLCVW